MEESERAYATACGTAKQAPMMSITPSQQPITAMVGPYSAVSTDMPEASSGAKAVKVSGVRRVTAESTANSLCTGGITL